MSQVMDWRPFSLVRGKFDSWNQVWQSIRPAVQKRHARNDFRVFQGFVETAKRYGHPVHSEGVLDIGCGYRFPVTLLLHSFGAHVTGIDTEVVAPRLSLSELRKYQRQNGLFAATRRAVRETIYKPLYFKALAAELGSPLRFDNLDVRTCRIEELKSQNEFDLVFSNATFEHLTDVDQAVRNLARVLRPQGLAYISIHLFPSLTGGHDVVSVPGTDFVRFRSGAYPWQHLRDPRWNQPAYLNRLREQEYRAIFERYLRVCELRTEFREPEKYLTDEILSELPEYRSEELLKRSIVVVARQLGRE